MVPALVALEEARLDDPGGPVERLALLRRRGDEQLPQSRDPALASRDEDPAALGGCFEPDRTQVVRVPGPIDEAVALQAGDEAGHRRGGDALVAGEPADGTRTGEDQHRQGRQPGGRLSAGTVLLGEPSQQVENGRVEAGSELVVGRG